MKTKNVKGSMGKYSVKDNKGKWTAYSINKQNWTGETGTYRVGRNKVKVGHTTYKTMMVINTGWGTRWLDVFNEDKVKCWTINESEEGIWSATSLGVEREGKTPHEVIARLHWNLVEGKRF